MKFTYNWLLDHLVTKADAFEIAEKLCEIGFEVENLEDYSSQLYDIKIGVIKKVEKHPNADKLSVCLVNIGEDNDLQVVCGASNVYVGMKTAFMPVGGWFPKAKENLKQAKIRGVESFGMLCSFEDIGLEKIFEDNGGIIDLESGALPGKLLIEVLELTDITFSISVTPNRGDCFSVRGIARELAAAGLGQLKPLDYSHHFSNYLLDKTYFFSENKFSKLENKVKISTENCSFLFGAIIEGVTNCDSPDWIKKRLLTSGQRPINAVVDITNFLSFDLGQPLHAYDYSKISGIIDIKPARLGEKIVALNLQEYELDERITLIAAEEKALSIAGIIGGESSSTEEYSKTIFLECAYFDPVSISIAGQALGIKTESRTRFERGVDPSQTEMVFQHCIQLIQEICGGEVKEYGRRDYSEESVNKAIARPNISVSKQKIAEVSGEDSITIEESEVILNSLGFKTIYKNLEVLEVAVPTWRHDVSLDVDLVEEILRIRGYGRISSKKLPIRQAFLKENPIETIRDRMCARGFCEVYTLPFLSRAYVDLFGARFKEAVENLEVLAPLNIDMPFLRHSLVPSLLKLVINNKNLNYKQGAFFEIESIFFRDKDDISEKKEVCGVRFGTTAKHWLEKMRVVDVFDVKADLLDLLDYLGVKSFEVKTKGVPEYYHPGRAGVIAWGRETLGFFGEIHPKILLNLEIDIPVVAFEFVGIENLLRKMKEKKIQPLIFSPFQRVQRDFAFIVEEYIAAGDIIRAVERANNMIEGVEIFDIYCGSNLEDGKKSVALHVYIQPKDKPLSEGDLKVIFDDVVLEVKKCCGGELRGGF